MHITKNVCESLLGTALNMPERTKDGSKARHDQFRADCRATQESHPSMAKSTNSAEHCLRVGGKPWRVTPEGTTGAPSQARVTAPTIASAASEDKVSPPPADGPSEPVSQHDNALDIDRDPIDTFIADMEADDVSPSTAPARHTLKKKLFLSQETSEQEDTTAFTAPPQIGLTPRILLGATTQELQNNVTPRCNKKKIRKRKKPGDVSASKTMVIDKLSTPWRTMHHLCQMMLPANIVKQLTPDMRSVYESVLMQEELLLRDINPSYPVLTAKVPTGFHFVTTYPADLMIIRLKYYTLILFHPYHSHVVYLNSRSDKRKDYTDVRPALDKALNGFIAKVDIDKLKHEKKVKGCYVSNHITNFPCLKQSSDDNGMEAWFVIVQMRAILRDDHDPLLLAGIQKRCVNMSGTTDANMTYYVVYNVRVPEVYEDWEDCRRQVHHFSGNIYKGYTTLEEAETRYANF
ncbi:hypothetical protein QYE76_007910 [Lolium multiflorum]|nr:hypothetical protein QYE76_007910 [Lolium multiflorum]